MNVIAHSRNRSSEVGRAIVHPAFRQSGVGSRLFQVCSANLYSGDSRLGFYIARSTTAHHMANRIPGFRAVLAGHDGGKCIANGGREYHMLAIARQTTERFRHLAPCHGPASDSSFVREDLYAPLGLKPAPAPYPDICFTGLDGEEVGPAFRYSFDCDAGAVDLVEHHGSGRTQAQVARDLEAFLARSSRLPYIAAQVLADKSELIRRMLQLGFAMTAYLPAWCSHGECRFDCVMLVKSQFAEAPAVHGFERQLRDLDRHCAELSYRYLHPQTADVSRLVA